MLHPKIAVKLGIPEKELGNIKNIIFDLGGVIIDIRYQATVDAFARLGLPNFENLYTMFNHNPVFELLETGKISPVAFRDELRKFSSQLSDTEIDHAWNSMLGNMPPLYIPLLKAIKANYNTYMFSNTNAIHIKHFYTYLEKTFGTNPFPKMFNKVYFSHEVGERKPYPKAFEKVLLDAGLMASETLFIDDLIANIEGARKAGILAYHLKEETIADLFLMS
jgi:glucose-1-phosphatase